MKFKKSTSWESGCCALGVKVRVKHPQDFRRSVKTNFVFVGNIQHVIAGGLGMALSGAIGSALGVNQNQNNGAPNQGNNPPNGQGNIRNVLVTGVCMEGCRYICRGVGNLGNRVLRRGTNNIPAPGGAPPVGAPGNPQVLPPAGAPPNNGPVAHAINNGQAAHNAALAQQAANNNGVNAGVNAAGNVDGGLQAVNAGVNANGVANQGTLTGLPGWIEWTGGIVITGLVFVLVKKCWSANSVRQNENMTEVSNTFTIDEHADATINGLLDGSIAKAKFDALKDCVLNHMCENQGLYVLAVPKVVVDCFVGSTTVIFCTIGAFCLLRFCFNRTQRKLLNGKKSQRFILDVPNKETVVENYQAPVIKEEDITKLKALAEACEKLNKINKGG